MIRLAHLRDEAEIGGVARMVQFLMDRLGAGFEQAAVHVAPSRLTPFGIDADVLVAHVTSIWTKVPYLAMLRLARAGRPLVLVEHSYTEHFIRRHVDAPQRFNVMLRTAYGLATHVVAVSHGQAAWMRANRLVPEDKLTVIRSATDMAGLAAIAAPAPRRNGAPMHLGAYGRYAEQKGFDLLVEAMHHIPPGLARLSLRGLGPDKDKLQTLALGLPHVVIGELVHDVADFLSTVDAVAVPSRWEAFGQVATEARAAARPVIATDVDGLSEQVCSEFGLLVPPDNVQALADAIRRMASADLTSLGEAARRSVASHGADHLAAWRTLLSAAARKPVALASQSSAT